MLKLPSCIIENLKREIMKFRGLLLPTLAGLGVFFAVRVVKLGAQEIVPAAPLSQPSQSPFLKAVAGAGIVEPLSENILIGAPFAGLVESVAVAAGQDVAAGAPLFILDQRELKAERGVRMADLAAAKADETAIVAQRDDARVQFGRVSSLQKSGVSSSEERDRARFLLVRLEAGSGAAAARVHAAEASLAVVETNLDRSVIRAPISGRLLQVRVRPGQYVQGGASVNANADAYCVIGDVSKLVVRTDIDENDAWRISANARGQAIVRGNNALLSPLTFLRIEPYIIPKRSLTGLSSERTDTRVLQVLFTVDDVKFPVYIGQQVDVYVEVAG